MEKSNLPHSLHDQSGAAATDGSFVQSAIEDDREDSSHFFWAPWEGLHGCGAVVPSDVFVYISYPISVTCAGASIYFLSHCLALRLKNATRRTTLAVTKDRGAA